VLMCRKETAHSLTHFGQKW